MKRRHPGHTDGMKILLLTDRLHAGGAETHLEALATGLAARGHSVTVLSCGGRIADRLEHSGIPVLRVPFPGRNPFRLLSLLRFLRRTVSSGGFDILHAHTRTAGVLLSCLPARAGARLVTVHAARYGCLTRRMCRGSAVIAVSEDLRAGLIETGAAPAESVHVIPNGIDTSLFSPPDEPPPPQTVLFASRLDPDCSRGAELLLSCVPGLLSRFPDLRVTVAGGGAMLAALSRIAECINRQAGRTVVTLPGAVDDMAPLYRTHRIAVGVSRVALEAAACGCAVLLAGNEGYGGILEADDSVPALSNFCCRGLGLPERPVFLADLTRLLTAPPDSGALRRRTVREFSADGMVTATERLYRALLPPACLHPLRVLVGGYAGCGNLGDDAILQGLTEKLRRERPDIRLSALTGSPSRDTGRFGIPCHSRRRLFSVLGAMLRADVFLLGGGSLLQDQTGRRSLAYYLFLLRLARLAHCRTATLALGIGPLRFPGSGRAVLRALRSCEAVTLRDPESLRWLTLHGFEGPCPSLVPDPAVFLPSAPPLRCQAIRLRLGLPAGAGLLCVSVRPLCPADDAPLCVLASAVRRVCDRFSLTPVFPVLDPAHDLAVTRHVIRLCGSGVLFLPDEAADLPALLREAALLVSMRLHALAFARQAGIPAIAISPSGEEPKLASFAGGAGFPHFYASRIGVAPLAVEMERILSKKQD